MSIFFLAKAVYIETKVESLKSLFSLRRNLIKEKYKDRASKLKQLLVDSMYQITSDKFEKFKEKNNYEYENIDEASGQTNEQTNKSDSFN